MTYIGIFHSITIQSYTVFDPVTGTAHASSDLCTHNGLCTQGFMYTHKTAVSVASIELQSTKKQNISTENMLLHLLVLWLKYDYYPNIY